MSNPSNDHHDADQPASEPALSRRVFLAATGAAGLGVALGGCAATPEQTRSLPGPVWPDGSPSAPNQPASPAYEPHESVFASVPAAVEVLPRRAWSTTAPTTSRMDRMLPVRHITVHHTAGPVFGSSDRLTTAMRLESIRKYHRDHLGWGDIGYHFAVDRAGRVWQCRPLAWQGAHVREHNEHNLGVVALGNFDHQEPTNAQLHALEYHVSGLMAAYRVPASSLRTHQEWVATACPGRHLQRYMVTRRGSGVFG